ncbi:MAG: TIGR02206 family membrane protein [Gammaproteobacteria bacterium]|nr:TIGR02206 family membrane protein [Gammaproteobacteria bacterium]|tara:strand:+ start:974 stop:1666 length:693 start_codon:yes stop_codon:yes gene_type:complete
MIDFSLSSPSHIIFTIICVSVIVFLPRIFVNKNNSSKNILIIGIISLILINQGMDFFREGYGANNWKLGLPLHLCDFSSASIILYFITKRREFFLFAFFAGIAGAGMAILTPDVLYSFPHIDYLRHMIGHSMILLGVTYAIIIDNQRPQLKDVHRILAVLSVFLLMMYPINTWLGPPANYWYVIEKPPGFNVTDLMRDAPYHMIDIYILAVIVCYSIYLPYFIKDRQNKN